MRNFIIESMEWSVLYDFNFFCGVAAFLCWFSAMKESLGIIVVGTVEITAVETLFPPWPSYAECAMLLASLLIGWFVAHTFLWWWNRRAAWTFLFKDFWERFLGAFLLLLIIEGSMLMLEDIDLTHFMLVQILPLLVLVQLWMVYEGRPKPTTNQEVRRDPWRAV